MDWNSAKEVMGLVKDIATIVLPLLGVLVGARLAGMTAEKNWLFQDRLTMYVDLIAKFEAANAIFSGQLKTIRFIGDPVNLGASGHKAYKSVVDEFYAAVSELTLVSTVVRILNRAYEDELHDQFSDHWIRMIGVVDYGNTTMTSEQWDACGTASGQMVLRLIHQSRRELAIPKKGIK